MTIIAAYTGYEHILAPGQLAALWPGALLSRVLDRTGHIIHIPFKQAPLRDAVSQFDCVRYPLGGALGIYSRETYDNWGL
jgi:hypothetical protein